MPRHAATDEAPRVNHREAAALASRARAVPLDVRATLRREDACGRLPVIGAALGALGTDDDPPPDPVAALRDAATVVRSMTRGPSSFIEYYVERAEANPCFCARTDELLAPLEDVRRARPRHRRRTGPAGT